MSGSALDIFYKPFYSRAFYISDATEGRGVGFLLLGALALLQIGFFYAMIHGQVDSALNNDMPAILEQVPTITIQDGQIAIDKPLPHYITIRMGGEDIGFIVFEDRNFGDPTALKDWMKQNHVFVLVGKTNIFALQPDRDELRMYDVRNAGNMVITREEVGTWILKARGWIWPSFFVFGTAGLWLANIICALFYSVLGLALNKFTRAQLEYGTILRFSSYAVWAATIVTIVAGLIKISIGGWISFLLTLGFLWYALRCVSWYSQRGKGRP